MGDIISIVSNALWFFKYLFPIAAVLFVLLAHKLYRKPERTTAHSFYIGYLAVVAVLCLVSTVIMWAPYYDTPTPS